MKIDYDKLRAEMSSTVYEIEACSFTISGSRNCSKPFFIVMKPSLVSKLTQAVFVEDRGDSPSVLNGRYRVIVSDSIDREWYLLVDTQVLTPVDYT